MAQSFQFSNGFARPNTTLIDLVELYASAVWRKGVAILGVSPPERWSPA